MSMYGAVETQLQDMSVPLTIEGCALSQSATRALPLWCATEYFGS